MPAATLSGLQAGFGNSLADVLPEIASQGCTVVRIDCQKVRDPKLAQEVLDAGMTPLVIVADPELIADLPKGSMVECGNERDIGLDGYSNAPLVYWNDLAAPSIAYCEDYGHRLFLGAVSNLHKGGLDWLRQLPWDAIPSWVSCSHHFYPDDGRPHASHISHLQFRYPFQCRNTRDQDVAELKAIVGERSLACSETGWWDGPYRTETDVAEWYRFERAFWDLKRYEFAIAYQLESAAPVPPDQWQPEHGYGFRRADGSWKPSAQAWFA